MPTEPSHRLKARHAMTATVLEPGLRSSEIAPRNSPGPARRPGDAGTAGQRVTAVHGLVAAAWKPCRDSGDDTFRRSLWDRLASAFLGSRRAASRVPSGIGIQTFSGFPVMRSDPSPNPGASTDTERRPQRPAGFGAQTGGPEAELLSRMRKPRSKSKVLTIASRSAGGITAGGRSSEGHLEALMPGVARIPAADRRADGNTAGRVHRKSTTLKPSCRLSRRGCHRPFFSYKDTTDPTQSLPP